MYIESQCDWWGERFATWFVTAILDLGEHQFNCHMFQLRRHKITNLESHSKFIPGSSQNLTSWESYFSVALPILEDIELGRNIQEFCEPEVKQLATLNWQWWVDLHHGNEQILKLLPFFFPFRELVKQHITGLSPQVAIR